MSHYAKTHLTREAILNNLNRLQEGSLISNLNAHLLSREYKTTLQHRGHCKKFYKYHMIRYRVSLWFSQEIPKLSGSRIYHSRRQHMSDKHPW